MDVISSPVIYRILRAINEAYALTVLWLYITVFIVAFSLMFVFPPGTLLLLFVSVFGLGLLVVLGKVLGWIQFSIARHAVQRGICPRCEGPRDDDLEEGVCWRCARCHTGYLSSGREAVEPMQA
jgi:hypothetical protein